MSENFIKTLLKLIKLSLIGTSPIKRIKKREKILIIFYLFHINELQSWEIEIYSNNTVSVHRKYELLDK